MLSEQDISAILLTFKLASSTTVLLFLIGTPLAWWLSRSQGRLRNGVAAIVAVPLVLPPSVLGFYLLITLGANGPIGKLTQAMGLGTLPFTFSGLVIASIIYSLPFMVQPLQASFDSINRNALEAASTLRASPLDRFFSVVIPLSAPGFWVAGVMTFTHTVGEFGVVLMLGGNIPGVSRVVSVQVYDYVESFQYAQAHALAGFLLVFSFLVLYALQKIKSRGFSV
jgi:molybdate transport system permease protein